MNFAKVTFLSMALAAVVAFTAASTLFAQTAAPCANGATIVQNDSSNDGVALVWKHHYAAADGPTIRSDNYYNGPAFVLVHDYNAAYHRDPVPCAGPSVQLVSAPTSLEKCRPPTRATASLTLSRQDREQLNALIGELRAQDGNVAAVLAKLENNNGDIRDILSAIKDGLQNSHDDTTVAALDKLSDTLANMVSKSSDAQIQLINTLAGGIGDLNKIQTQLLTVEQKRLKLEKDLVFWTRWGALANTAIAAAEWSQFGLAMKTGGYGASAAASASAAALAREAAAAKPVITF
jgi:hypothetical protein